MNDDLRSLQKKLRAAKTPPAPPRRPKTAAADYNPLPVDCLPEPIRAIVTAAAPAFDCDPAFLALPCLGVAASLIGNTRMIQLKRGFVQPCVLWFALIAKSGSGKSPPFRWATNHVYKVQAQYLKEYERQEEDYQAAVQAWEFRERSRLKSGDDGRAEPRPVKPPSRRLLTNDSTIERLYELLEDNPRGLLLSRDELGAFFANMSRYKTSGSDLQGWLELYEGGHFVLDRKGGDKPTRSIQRASMSIIGGIQPGTLQRGLTDEFLEAGLGARYLMAWPPFVKRRWVEKEIDHDTNYYWQRLIEALLALDFVTGQDGELAAVTHTLDAAAKEEWVRWYDTWAAVVADTPNDFLQAAYSKIPGQAARLALLHHVVTYTWGQCAEGYHPAGPVTADSIRAAVKLACWFASEAARVYRASTPEAVLLAWIADRGGQCTPRELVMARKFTRSHDAYLFLNDLVSSGRGVWLKEEKKKQLFCLLPPDRPAEKP